jgi:mannosyltransferase
VITSLPLTGLAPRFRVASRARVDLALGLTLGLLALALDVFRLSTASLWGDEVYSVGLARAPWDTFSRLVFGGQSNMALFYLTLRGWLSLLEFVGATPTDLLVRLPSLVFAALSVALVFQLGLRVSGRFVGAIAALLYMLNFIELSLSGEVRSYALELLLVCISWWLFLSLLEGDSGLKSWLIYGSVAALAVSAHLFSVFVVAAQALAFVALFALDPPSRRRLLQASPAFAVALFLVAVVALPLLTLGLSHGGDGGGGTGATSSFTEAARTLWNMSGHNLLYGALFCVASIAGLAVLRSRGWGRGRQSDTLASVRSVARSRTILLVSWVVVPALLSFIASSPLLRMHVFSYRYLVVVVPALVIIAGLGLRAIRGDYGRRLAAALLVIAALPALPLYYSTVHKQDYRSASLWIEQRYESRDGLICGSWSCGLAMPYYLWADRGPTELTAAALGQYSWSQDRITRFEADDLSRYLASHGRVFLVHAPLASDSVQDEARAESTQTWLRTHSVIIAEATFNAYYGPVEVQLYAAR